MRYFFLLLTIASYPFMANAQFKPVDEDRLTILVTDGTDAGKDSKIQQSASGTRMVPKSYDMVEGGPNLKGLIFSDPIKPLGMEDAIQAAAFLDRPVYGRAGFMLIFSVNDSIGGKQGTYIANGTEYKGVYRLIRTKYTPEEPVPGNMAAYKITGTIFILGVS